MATHDEPTVELVGINRTPSNGTSSLDEQGSDSTQAAPNLGFVKKGRSPHFAGETEVLLRSRLRAAAIDLMFVLGLGYVLNLVYHNYSWLALRSFILALISASYFFLRSREVIKMPFLRCIEGVLFGGVAIQVALMMYSRTRFFAEQGDATSMASAQSFYFTAFCLHILTYGIFIPNNWRRACVVTMAIAFVPYVIWWLLRWTTPSVAEMAALNHADAPLPTTLVASIIGTFGSHIIYRTRREAFQAKQILQYRLGEQIGSGGMGEVYRAEHVLLKRPCAMKLIRSDKNRDKQTLERFEREVIATAKLSHWNTVDIYDYGHTDDGTFYYVMELLRGENLQTIIQRYGPMPASRVAYILVQACDALTEAHNSGLIHRDIKPANIYLAHCGGIWDVVKILDFGLVLQKSDETTSEVVVSKGFSGTPQYMAPEQATRYDQVDARTDIYALGAVAYYLLTGRPPFSGTNAIDLVVAHATQSLVPPSQIRPDVPDDLERVVLQALEKSPLYRYDGAQAMRDEVLRCACYREWNPNRASQWWEEKENMQTHGSAPQSTEDLATATMQGVPLDVTEGLRSSGPVNHGEATLPGTIDLH